MKSVDTDNYDNRDVSRRLFIKYIAAAAIPLFSATSGCCGCCPISTPTPAPTITTTPTPSLQINVPIKPINLCYSPFRDGQNPELGPGMCVYPTTDQIDEDIKFLSNITTCIRTYSSSNIHVNVPEIAKKYQLLVHQGIFLGDDSAVNEDEIRSAKTLVDRNLVDSLIVGNETLMLNKLPKDKLIDYIRSVKKIVPSGLPVTTADGWVQWRDNEDLVNEVDYILVHIYPFWDDKPVEGAASYVLEKYQLLKDKYPGKEIIIGETGWPSAGDPLWTGVSSSVIPGEYNQSKFVEEFDKLAQEKGIKYFLFEAFDEEWKWKERRTSGSGGSTTEPYDRNYCGNYAGSSWGIFRSNSALKSQLSKIFSVSSMINSRFIRDICVGSQLCAGYDMGVDSSGKRYDWVKNDNGSMCMSYPAGQSWGSVFITVGQPKDKPRPWKDYSKFSNILVDLRGVNGGESIGIGVKDAEDPDDGSEIKIKISNIPQEWKTYSFKLSDFYKARIDQLYVVLEFVFDGDKQETVYFRNIRYTP